MVKDCFFIDKKTDQLSLLRRVTHHRKQKVSTKMDALWGSILKAVEQKTGDDSYKKWFDNLNYRIEEKNLVIKAPNEFVRDWIEQNYGGVITETALKDGGADFHVQIVIGSDEQIPLPGFEEEAALIAKRPANRKKKEPRAKTVSGFPLNPKYTFSRFVVGSSNQFAHAASKAVADKPANVYNPLFIFGGVGLGKTHLLNAVGHQIQDKHPNAIICYVSAEQFMNEVITSLRFDRMPQLRQKFRDGIDVLLLDDVHFLAGKERTQEEFFHTFNSLYESRRQIVITSDKYPKDIKDLEERLRSRFEWGLVADIQPPDLETKVAILKKKAAEDRLALGNDLALFLATHLGSNIRELEGSLTRVFAYSSINKVDPTPEMAREVLGNLLGSPRAITIDSIQKVVADFFNLKISDLKSHRKLKIIALPRQISMYLARKYTNCSFPEIGGKFGGKDHSTVIHAVRKIEKKIEEDPSLKSTVETLKKNLSL